MFGDCQVMGVGGGGGGNMVSTENLFSSPIGNPNFNFLQNIPFHPFSSVIPKEENGLGIRPGKEEMMDSGGSGSEQVEDTSGNDQESTHHGPAKKKRYHRHTARQIQEMEALFKECPHPDDKQRMKLSTDLGLKPRQVKFWFQNRRTQMKAQQDRSDNIILRTENESLKNDNYRLQTELRNLACPNCGGPAILGAIPFEELRLENARLREELERMCCIASRYTGQPIQAMAPHPSLVPPSLDLDMGMYSSRQFPGDPMGSCGGGDMMMPMLPDPSSFADSTHMLMEEEKPLAMELALSSMDELVRLYQANEPLWIRNSETGRETLNHELHSRIFPNWPLNLKQRSSDFRAEATRDSAMVIMNSINLVDAFLDANKWMELFPSIVTRARTVQVITQGASGGANGSLHLMYAELQVLSPLVPTREAYFLRFCQKNAEEGTWEIVDFPIDTFHDNIQQQQQSFPSYTRRPSGCIIQDMPNGYSRVTWIEHVEIEEKPVHQIFSHYVCTGRAFGAHRWLAVLQRQCERVASLMARNISDLGVIHSPEARKNLMRLAQRMIRTFSTSISTSGGQSWTALSDSTEDTVRITTRKNTEPGQPNGVILCGVSTTWLPYQHYQVFDLLRDEHRRSQIEVLSNGNALQEVAHIANGSHPGNCISLLRNNVASNSSQHVELMLQESCTDQSGSLVVYSSVDVDSIKLAMNGEDLSRIPLLPLGFSIVPADDHQESIFSVDEGSKNHSIPSLEDGTSAGCLLTVGLQVLASTIPTAKLNLSTVSAINNHLCNTVHQISDALAAAAATTTVNTHATTTSSNGNVSCNEASPKQ